MGAPRSSGPAQAIPNGGSSAAAARAPVARAAQRTKVFRQIWLETSAGSFRAHVLNVSPIGACVHARCQHRAWSGVVLRAGELAVEGRVTWTNQDLFGVKFLQPLSSADMQALIDGDPSAMA